MEKESINERCSGNAEVNELTQIGLNFKFLSNIFRIVSHKKNQLFLHVNHFSEDSHCGIYCGWNAFFK